MARPDQQTFLASAKACSASPEEAREGCWPTWRDPAAHTVDRKIVCDHRVALPLGRCVMSSMKLAPCPAGEDGGPIFRCFCVVLPLLLGVAWPGDSPPPLPQRQTRCASRCPYLAWGRLRVVWRSQFWWSPAGEDATCNRGVEPGFDARATPGSQ
jgi:hypothetical protein